MVNVILKLEIWAILSSAKSYEKLMKDRRFEENLILKNRPIKSDYGGT